MGPTTVHTQAPTPRELGSPHWRGSSTRKGHGPPRNLAAWDSATAQNPGAEGEAAGAADRQQRIRGLLGEADLDARSPMHPIAEDGPENQDVGRAGQKLQHGAEPYPDGLCAGKTLSEGAQPWEQEDHGNDSGDNRGQNNERSPLPRSGEFARERLGLELEGLGVGGGDRSSPVIGVDLGKLTLLNVGAKWALESLLGLLSPGRASGEAAPLTIGGWKRGDPAPDSSPRPILVRPWYPTMGPSWGNHLCRCLAPVMIRAKGNNT